MERCIEIGNQSRLASPTAGSQDRQQHSLKSLPVSDQWLPVESGSMSSVFQSREQKRLQKCPFLTVCEVPSRASGRAGALGSSCATRVLQPGGNGSLCASVSFSVKWGNNCIFPGCYTLKKFPGDDCSAPSWPWEGARHLTSRLGTT